MTRGADRQVSRRSLRQRPGTHTQRETDDIQPLLEQDDRTAGRIMSPEVSALSEDFSVRNTIQAFQESRTVERSESRHRLTVLDPLPVTRRRRPAHVPCVRCRVRSLLKPPVVTQRAQSPGISEPLAS